MAFHFDIQSLFATQGLICLVFALGLFLLHRRFQQVKGSLHLSLTFVAAALSAGVFLLRGSSSLTWNVLLSNFLLLVANLLFYYGVSVLLGIRPRIRIPIIVCLLSLIPGFYFTAIHDVMLVRAIFFSLANMVVVCYMLADLVAYPLRRSLTRPLIGTMAFYLLVILMRTLSVLTHYKTPSMRYGYDLVEPSYMVVGVFAAVGIGIFSMVLVGSEITASIERNARRDHLTDSFNRRGIEELLSSELDRSRRSNAPLAVALIDVDHFKSINDAAGHAAGDDTLRSVAASIASHLRVYDACGRLGGDEFLILLPGSQASNAAQICERILHQVSALPTHALGTNAITLSIGFTEYIPGDTNETILARADRALYSAKRDGRNCAHMDLAFLRAMPTNDPVQQTSPVRTSSLRRPSNPGRDA